jgi:hypothetical protein
VRKMHSHQNAKFPTILRKKRTDREANART